MASDQDTFTLTARCLCGKHAFTTSIPPNKLPLKAHACHCNSCRHVTGALYTTCTPWPEPRAKIDLSGLKAFDFGPSTHLLSCGTCSTPMFWANKDTAKQELGVLTGTLDNFDSGGKEVIQVAKHIYVGATKDGGATMWMRKINAGGVEARRYEVSEKGEDDKEYPFDWPSAESLTGYEKKTEDSVPIRCKCKGVDLVWHRGNYDGVAKKDLPWFIDPVTHKSLAGFCADDSCRLFGGVDVWSWVYTELNRISFPGSTKTFPISTAGFKDLVDAKDPCIGTLAYYASRSDVQRYFCGTCSASIFYAVDKRPDMVDLAVGVLEASDGARAEGFLSWAFGQVGRTDDVVGSWRHAMFEGVGKESEEWRIARGYPKAWRRVAGTAVNVTYFDAES